MAPIGCINRTIKCLFTLQLGNAGGIAASEMQSSLSHERTIKTAGVLSHAIEVSRRSTVRTSSRHRRAVALRRMQSVVL